MIEFYTDEELAAVPTGSVFVFDSESYSNYFSIGFRNIVTKKHVYFEQSIDSTINTTKLRWFLWRYCIVGFNSLDYDMLMLTAALEGWHSKQLNDLSFEIIKEGLRDRDFEKKYGLKIPQTNHVDLIEVAPLKGSLKLYAGRLHCKRMQDLPYDPYKALTKEEAINVADYLLNDLQNTELLLIELAPHIELRQVLGVEYGRDLRSLSDAQVAEAIIGVELHKATGYYPRRPTKLIKHCSYKIPAWLRFQTPALIQTLDLVGKCTFFINEANGKATMPDSLKKLSLNIGNCIYKMGMGGLHSKEQETCYTADEETLIIDRDVASYYPRIVLNQELYPSHLGRTFLVIFDSIVERRLAAKAAGNKKISEGLKIAINGVFGKLGNKFSILYSPDLLLQVTLTGQLAILMLIEAIELVGIPVVSGNTDGVVIRCPKHKYQLLQSVIEWWEKTTGFTTEETRYKAIYSRDVNNYIALKEDNKCKLKGIYAEVGSAQNSVLSKNPEVLICSDAVQKLLTNGVPIEDTITKCRDIRRFTAVRMVDGGAVKDDAYLGKCVRWYYAKNINGCIEYKNNGNKVAKTDGAKPLMILPDQFPEDVDFKYYINETIEMLYCLGYYKRVKTLDFFN